MRWKYTTAVEILTEIEKDTEQKTEFGWVNRILVYGVLKRKGYRFRIWKGKPSRWIKPLSSPV